MLDVEGLTVAYGQVVALESVSVAVQPGSTTAVLGANGAGKTTLVRAISGLLRPRAGTIRLDGRDITGHAPEAICRLGLAHVPEGRGVIEELTVEDNLRVGGLWRRERHERATAIAEAVELFPVLGERRRLPAAALSGGERQMLAIARALIARPRVLLLDEPSLGLAGRVVAQIMLRLKQLVQERRLAVLLIEQNARSALSVADDAVVLALGRVVAHEPAAQLRGEEGLRHAYLGF